MNAFNNLRVAVKLALGFGISLFLTALVGVVAWMGLNSAKENVHILDKRVVTNLQNLDTFNGAARQARIFQDQVTILNDDADIKISLEEVEKYRAQANKALEAYGKLAVDQDERVDWQKLVEGWNAYDQLYLKWRPIISNPKTSAKEDERFSKETAAAFEAEVREPLETLVTWNDKHSTMMADSAEASVTASTRQSLVILIVAIAVGSLLAFLIARAISRPIAAIKVRLDTLNETDLTSLANAMSAMQKGDLTLTARVTTEPADIDQKDEIGQMATTFNAMLAKTGDTFGSYESMRQSLSAIVRQLQESASNVAATSGQLERASDQTGQAANEIAQSMQEVAGASDSAARGSGDIARGSEQLAKATTDAAAYMVRLDEAIEQIEEGSHQQKLKTDEAHEIANVGRESVGRTVASMQRIQQQVEASSQAVRELGEKGQQIGDIVQTIEDIAKQTNLLALNAAIEAARAGEQGKGFAIVADEVRKLAERSATATKEIGTLIASVRSGVDLAVAQMEASTSEVEIGAANSSEAGDALTQITTAVSEVSLAAGSNAASIESMATSARKVAESISAAAAVSEETAAGAEEMNASAEEVAASTQTVSAAIQEQTAQIEEVSASAMQLKQLAENLNSIAQQFRVEEQLRLAVAA